MPQRGIRHQGRKGSFQLPEIGLDTGSQVREHVFAEPDAFAEGAGTQHFQTGGIIRFQEFYGQAPLEAGHEPVFEILKVYRGAVAGEDELFPVLVQVVEYIEESILGALAGQVLDVVHNEHVNALVEGDEIYNPVPLPGIHVLGLEFMAGYVQDHQFRELFLDGNADGLGDVRFSQTRASVEEERVEGCFAGRLGNAFRSVHSQFVALPFHQVAEAVYRIQARVDLEPLQAREHKGTGLSSRLVSGNRDGIVGGGRCRTGRQHHPFLLCGAHQIEQLAIRSDGSPDGEPEQLFVRLFYILAEEIRRDLNGELGSFQGHRPDELEPGIELLRINVVLDDLQTVIPYRNMSFLVGHQGLGK